MRRFVLFGLTASLAIIFSSGILLAQEKKGFDAKKREFCKIMISHGEEAYKRGDYEKAGYYFLQAVQADSARMAEAWFKMKGIKGGEQSSIGIKPEPPVKAPSSQGEKSEEPAVIIGDDEGC
jgi:hypothetical protein